MAEGSFSVPTRSERSVKRSTSSGWDAGPFFKESVRSKGWPGLFPSCALRLLNYEVFGIGRVFRGDMPEDDFPNRRYDVGKPAGIV